MQSPMFTKEWVSILRWPLMGQASSALCVISVLLCLPAALCTACPQKCRCDDLQFYCDAQGLLEPPDGVDKGAVGLSLRHNGISELNPEQFLGFSQLTWLHLDHNQILGVHEDTFQGLYKLKDLNLSSNRITKLPNTAFVHLVNLQILDLSFNQMTALEPELFHRLRKLQILHLRSNLLRTMPVRAFWDCWSLEYLSLNNNRLRSLARNGFAGLVKLRELHLEHNHLTKINLAHFPRLVALKFLYLQWNKINNVSCTMEWQWTTLEKLDLTGNEIHTLTPDVFETLPNLRVLLLDSNKLSSINSPILDLWKSLNTIGLSNNFWECTKQICDLATWLSRFSGQWEQSILCHSPEFTHGEEILDAVHGFQLCQNFSAPLILTSASTEAQVARFTSPSFGNTQTPTTTPRFYADNFKSFNVAATTVNATVTQTFSPTTDATSVPNVEDGTEDYALTEDMILTQRIIMGTMALLFSFFLILFVIYVSWKCCPQTLQQICKQKRTQQRQPATALTPQEPYNEGSLVIINGFGQCNCQQAAYKECEV